MDQHSPEAERPVSHLPMISQETRDKILDDVGVKEVKASLGRSDRIFDYASNILSDVSDVSPEVVRALKDITPIDQVAKPEWAQYRVDKIATGMAVVLGAFHAQSDFRLINDLAKLTPEDINNLIRTQKFPDLRGNMFEKALSTPRIPANQTFLKDIIDEVRKSQREIFNNDFQLGATQMYHIMEGVWGKIYPQVPNGGAPQSISQPPYPTI